MYSNNNSNNNIYINMYRYIIYNDIYIYRFRACPRHFTKTSWRCSLRRNRSVRIVPAMLAMQISIGEISKVASG